MSVTTIILPKAPAKKPIKLPIADFSATVLLFFAYFSPRKAPRNGPNSKNNIPKPDVKKVIKTPSIRPIVLPFTPYLEPPNFLVPSIGT